LKENTAMASRTTTRPIDRALREALAPYIDPTKLRRLAAQGDDLQGAITPGIIPPAEVQALLDTLAVLLRPLPRERIKSPADVAALLMVEMANLDQEEFRVLHLNTKNQIQSTLTLYRGTVNSAIVRVGEVFKEALRLNSAGIIVAHQHPSGCPDPSPEDILITRQIADAGKLLDIEVLDSLVIGRGKWVSLRERGLGFPKGSRERK
jgi:DNA repair protein RadC